jgi:DNA-3-methyladenine glycosylase I
MSGEVQLELKRCKWCEGDPLLSAYHDHEWGISPADDFKLFEALTLEIFQAGLSWRTILYKREGFREAFALFDFYEIASFSEASVEELMQNSDIVRNRRKIEATIKNAEICIQLIEHHGSLNNYLETLPQEATEKQKVLKKTFNHVGLTTAESFLMAIGLMVPHHEPNCFLAN